MKIFIIIATVVACIYAAPLSELLHPSPVNPNVLVELKPAEKIILITDPKEMAKFKRETQQPFYPTVLPPEGNNRRAKREYQRGQQIRSNDPLPLQKPQTPNKPSLNKRNRREVEPVKVTKTLSNANAAHIIVEVYQKPLLSATEEPISQTSEGYIQKPIENNTHPEKPEVSTEKPSRPQGLPAIFSPSKKQRRDVSVSSVPTPLHLDEPPEDISREKLSHECKTEYLAHNQALKTQNQHKRDIPVPLVPKHHHPEESPKADNEKENKENKMDINLENHDEIQHTKEGIQKHQILPAVLKESSTETQLQKRDIPVPLVPKHHHPEESLNEEKEVLNSEYIHDSLPKLTHVIPAHNEDHVTHELVQKPTELQQHKRDIPMPLVSKPQQSEDFSKDSGTDNKDDKTEFKSDIHNTQQGVILRETSIETQQKRDITSEGLNKMASNGDRKEVHMPEDDKKPQALPEISDFTNNQQHNKMEDIHLLSQTQHLPQTLPAHSNQILNAHNHQTQRNAENVATIPLIHKFQPNDNNKYTPHFHQRLAGQSYVTEKSVIFSQDQTAYNKKTQVLPVPSGINFQNSQTISAYNQEHVTPTDVDQQVLQKPQIMPAVTKVTTESIPQMKHDVLTPLETSEQSHRHKTEKENQELENYSHPDNVQVEDISEVKPLHQPNIHQIQLSRSEHKPNILDDHLAAYNLPSSTTDHPVIRHKPVSVAELFARAHDN